MYTITISMPGECGHSFQSKYGDAMDEAYLHGQAKDGEVVSVYKEDELIDQVHFCGTLENGGKWQRGQVRPDEGR